MWGLLCEVSQVPFATFCYQKEEEGCEVPQKEVGMGGKKYLYLSLSWQTTVLERMEQKQ